MQLESIQSLITFRNSQGLQARGTLLTLTRSTIVFEVYNPYSIVQMSEVLREVSLHRGEQLVYHGKAMVSNLVNTGLMVIVSVSLIDDWCDFSGLFDTPQSTRKAAEQFITDWETSNQLRPGYQLIVGQLRSFLAELNRWLEQVNISDEKDGLNHDATQNEFLEELGSPLIPWYSELFQTLEYEASQISEEDIVIHKQFLQHNLHPLIMRAPFVHRAFSKPLGYAGDYEMVNMMLRNDFEGPSMYAKLIHKFHIQTDIARAHANRIDILEHYLTQISQRKVPPQRAFNILNLGCGPAVEVQRFIQAQSSSEQCCFQLMDFNEETLGYTKTKLGQVLQESTRKVKINFIHKSVHFLLKQAINNTSTEDRNQFDFVYCAGLFDYLSDKVCARLIRLFYLWVKPGGIVLISNVHPSNKQRFGMEFSLEWHLIYRDEKKISDLASKLSQQRVFTDTTGVNVFLEIIKPLETKR